MYWHKTYKLHIFQFISISPFCSIRPSLCLLFNAWFHFDNFENERNSPHPMLMPKKHDVNNVGHSITIETAYLSVFLQWASQSLSIQVGLPASLELPKVRRNSFLCSSGLWVKLVNVPCTLYFC